MTPPAKGLLAIDPGAVTGIAFFTRDVNNGPWTLKGARRLGPDEVYAVPHDKLLVVIENPQIYPNSKARPNDILKLARIVGRYEERYKGSDRMHLVSPRDWKGSIDGDIMTARIKAALTPDEHTIAAQYKYDHNMLDAIGMGKWAIRQPWAKSPLL